MRGSVTTTLSYLGALALGASCVACTVLSGVEDMELRSRPTAPAPPPANAGDGGPANPSGDPQSGPTGNTKPPAPTGPATCGAAGSWTDCDPSPTLTTCAARCTARGLTCVEDCCAYDSVGDYRAKAGLIYAIIPSLECSQTSVSGSGKGGLCTDPTLLAGAGGAEVRCCCK